MALPGLLLIYSAPALFQHKKTIQPGNVQISSGNEIQNANFQNKEKLGVSTIEMPKQNHDPREIERAAQAASDATGVRKDFLMGLLVVETNLGKNIGKCTYAQVETGAFKRYESGQISRGTWRNFLRRNSTFKRIAGNLGYDYQMLKVSCNPPYAGTGGAMGVAQFMPDTWMVYEERVGQIVGKTNPDPWDPNDAVMAMALKLSDVPGVRQKDHYAEMKAAKIYLSGTTSSRYNWYANLAMYWSRNYSRLTA